MFRIYIYWYRITIDYCMVETLHHAPIIIFGVGFYMLKNQIFRKPSIDYYLLLFYAWTKWLMLRWVRDDGSGWNDLFNNKKSDVTWCVRHSVGLVGLQHVGSSRYLLSEPLWRDFYGRESKQRWQPIFNSRSVGTLSTFW